MNRDSALGTRPPVLGGVVQILDRLACPECQGRLEVTEDGTTLRCCACATIFRGDNGVADLRPASARGKPELEAWSRHWSPEAQQSASQRFFSFYRKAVFARAVAYFVRRHFPRSGVFVEAGSGTSETSLRIDKAGGRVLVAVDIVPQILERCAPVMDVRLGGDIFRLPFRDQSVDGIWNVGVMEHFPHPQIDLILREIARVLRPGGRVILLWPATDSIPQKLLRALEWVINLRREGGARFQFHPDEISKLRSAGEGREVLRRNGLEPVEIEFGLRTLMAFKTVIGRRGADDEG